ncbi:hypothetical protein BT63DRAFT_419783 [Microthyrium microscopicum]|uniref:Uncharacterized protein n=1 Tax=Microthyrium microscopicum TaxID=703497 RepID=A0A6A6UQE5_9PEZI|nr:hypothetical protein BT63DRAFT_419783 [Microthyrium microscopicum]
MKFAASPRTRFIKQDLSNHYKLNKTNSTTIIMSNQQSNFTSKSFSSSTFTSSRNDEAPQTWKSTQSTSTDARGTTVHRSSQQPGQDPTEETLHMDSRGKLIPGESQEQGRIEDADDSEKK